MFWHKLKDNFELIKKHYSEEEIVKRRKELLEEFANPEDFGFPQPEITVEKKDKTVYTFLTKLNRNDEIIKIETIISEINDDTYISFKVNDSLSRNKKQDLMTTTDIITVVSLNYLNYFGLTELINKNNRINVIFETTNDNKASIYSVLLSFFDILNLTFGRKKDE